jgi:hypothetical protein
LMRDEPNRLRVSADSVDASIQEMTTQECRSPLKWGGEIRFGRRFGTGNAGDPGSDANAYWAVEATYWTTDRFHGYKEIWGEPNPINTSLDVSGVHFNSFNTSATDWFNGAGQQWLERYNEIHNVEIALIGGRWAVAGESPWDFAWSIGPRFFYFNEKLTFGTVQAGSQKAADAFNAYLRDDIVNTLWGCQLGCEVGYHATAGLRFFAVPKAGVYGNHLTNHFGLALGDGTLPLDLPAEVNATKNCASFLMQIDVGAEYFFARYWSLRAGYRLLAVSGIGLADHQIPRAMPEALEMDIRANGELLLHGGFVSLTYNF